MNSVVIKGQKDKHASKGNLAVVAQSFLPKPVRK
jgi:hypothetical protein